MNTVTKLIVFSLSIILIMTGFYEKIFAEDSLVYKAQHFKLFDSQFLNADLKFVDQEKGYFGIDYQLRLEKKLWQSEDNGSSKNFNLKSDGFIMVAGEKNDLNSIVNELNAELFPLFRQEGGTMEIPSLEDEMDSLGEETEKEIIKRTREQAKIVQSPLWINANLHLKHETTQDFKEYDLALGAVGSISTSYLNAVLDYLFGMLRVGENNNPRQFEISVGYDFVTNLDETANQALRDYQDNANRLNIGAEWETGIFIGDRLLFLYNSYYEINAPQAVKDADKDFNNFFQITYEHLLYKEKNAETSFAVKYTTGELPPNFVNGSVLGGGIRIEF